MTRLSQSGDWLADRGAGGLAQVDLKPFLLWVPSQKGLLEEPPHRHRKVSVPRVTVRPVPEQTSSGPSILSGPFGRSVTLRGPLRTASGGDS